jgi:hypothetical protein
MTILVRTMCTIYEFIHIVKLAFAVHGSAFAGGGVRSLEFGVPSSEFCLLTPGFFPHTPRAEAAEETLSRDNGRGRPFYNAVHRSPFTVTPTRHLLAPAF